MMSRLKALRGSLKDEPCPGSVPGAEDMNTRTCPNIQMLKERGEGRTKLFVKKIV
jgi:hypothetical protein